MSTRSFQRVLLPLLFWRWSLSNDDDPLRQRKHELLDKKEFSSDLTEKIAHIVALKMEMDTVEINRVRLHVETNPTNHDEFSCSAQFHKSIWAFYGKNKLKTTWMEHDAFRSRAKKVFYDLLDIEIAIGAMINDASIIPFLIGLEQITKSIWLRREFEVFIFFGSDRDL